MNNQPNFGGFMYKVSLRGDGTVHKILRKPGNTSISDETSSYLLHREYLGEKIVPELEISDSNNSGFLTVQEKVENGNPIKLIIKIFVFFILKTKK